MKNIIFKIAKWFLYMFSLMLISLLTIVVIVFLTDLISNLPILKSEIKYDPIAISNTFIVYVTFIVVIGTIILTLAGFYFQRSIAKRESEILNENMDKVLNAITTDKEGFRENLVKELLEHKNIQPLIQEKLDQRVKSFESLITDQKKSIRELQESLSTLAEGFNSLPISFTKDIIFDIDKKDK